MTISEIKAEAKERFMPNRYHAMLIYGVVYTLGLNIGVLTMAFCLLSTWTLFYSVILIILFFLLLAPFGYGMAGFFLRAYKGEKADALHIFDGFNKYNLERVVVLHLLRFALGLAFTLLLIVPGIIFSARTSMSMVLMRANPNRKPKDALRTCNKAMKVHCWKYVGLQLSFIGWFLLSIVSCGLALIWVLPYFQTAKIVFYKRELQGDTAQYRSPTAKDSDAGENSEEEALRKQLMAEIESMNAQLEPSSAQVKKKTAQGARTHSSPPPVEQVEDPPVVVQASEGVYPADEAVYSASELNTEDISVQPQESTEYTDEIIVQREEPMQSVEEPVVTVIEEDSPIVAEPPIVQQAEDMHVVVHSGQASAEQRATVVPRASERVASTRSVPPRSERVQPRESTRVESVRTMERSERRRSSEPSMRSVERGTLPGGRVIVDENGRHTVDRASSRESTPRATTPRTDATTESREERLQRIRAARATQEGQEQTTRPRGSDRSERTARTTIENRKDS